MNVLEKALTALEDYGLGYKNRVGVYSFTSITVANTIATVTFPSTTGITPGMFFYIPYGGNEGCHLITAVTTYTISYVDITAVAQLAGSGTAYQIKTKAIQDIIAKQTDFIKDQVGLPFNGVQEFTEYHDGSGTSELMLDRRNINALVSIYVISEPNWQFAISTNSVEIIPNQGILRARLASDMQFQAKPALFPKGDNNIKVTYLAGFSQMPADLEIALQLLVQADILGEAAAQAGDPASINVVSWSRSWSNPRGQYGNIRNQWYAQAMDILRGYMSGVVG